MQVQQLLTSATQSLENAGVAEAVLEAELLLRHCLDVSRSRLFLLAEHHVDPEQQICFETAVTRRCRREPLQYITGSCEFWSLDFLVGPAVLIPRPETEFLLEHVVSVVKRTPGFSVQYPKKILDLCTGSGVIAAVLAREFPLAAVTATDYSEAALEIAHKNFVLHELAGRINLLCADLLTALTQTPLFDVIVSNPPYVKSGDLNGLEPEVRDWEPTLALSGGVNGMETIIKICHDAPYCLKPGGWLFMEIGADIQQAVEQVFCSHGSYTQVRVTQDWSGRPRVVQARYLG
jgi:release factor glutamine methyltransferase